MESQPQNTEFRTNSANFHPWICHIGNQLRARWDDVVDDAPQNAMSSIDSLVNGYMIAV